MRKSSLIVLAALSIFGVAALLLLHHYKLEMIHEAILNAVLQKAPADYPQSRIRNRFSEVLQDSQGESQSDIYLARLLALAQRLEKIQHLDHAEVDQLLEDLDKEPEKDPNEIR